VSGERQWEWIELETVLDAHDEQIRAYGGSHGIRDLGALESAIDRPRNHAAYGVADPHLLAAAYAHGIALNHPFVDGNKRTAFVVSVAFLELNGYVFLAPENEATRVFLELAEGKLTMEALATWFRTFARAN